MLRLISDTNDGTIGEFTKLKIRQGGEIEYSIALFKDKQGNITDMLILSDDEPTTTPSSPSHWQSLFARLRESCAHLLRHIYPMGARQQQERDLP